MSAIFFLDVYLSTEPKQRLESLIVIAIIGRGSMTKQEIIDSIAAAGMDEPDMQFLNGIFYRHRSSFNIKRQTRAPSHISLTEYGLQVLQDMEDLNLVEKI